MKRLNFGGFKQEAERDVLVFWTFGGVLRIEPGSETLARDAGDSSGPSSEVHRPISP